MKFFGKNIFSWIFKAKSTLLLSVLFASLHSLLVLPEPWIRVAHEGFQGWLRDKLVHIQGEMAMVFMHPKIFHGQHASLLVVLFIRDLDCMQHH